MTSRGLQLKSCLLLKQKTEYVQLACKTESCSLRIIQTIQPPYTLGIPSTSDQYLSKVIRSKLARESASIFEGVREELVVGIDELIPVDEHSTWQSFG